MSRSHPVRCDETVWITLSDGCRLAARIWRPEGTGPVPAILEYLPYRRRDRHRGDDAVTHPALAAAGYACVRVDMRGAGDSDGVMHDEYTPQEWADAAEVIDWIAARDFCDGTVGMMGLSWSGFNALQVAATGPGPLKAIVTTCASDDRYADDMHYMGGCLLNDNLQYGATLFTWLGTPPDPVVVGDRWRGMWLDRLAAVEPPALLWMRHALRDDYWRSGSVCEDYGRITIPVLAVGGWADGYTNAVLRLLGNLSGPRKGLIGPWAHAYPHVASPGPAIDFIAVLVRWWDHWLKGRDTGLMDEPMLTCWLQESEPPRPSYALRRGRWTGVAHWPPEGQGPLTLFADPAGDRLQEAEAASGPVREVTSPPATGTGSGEWCPYGWGPDMPLDQRRDDACSVVFDTAPLDAPLALLGGASVELALSCRQDEGVLAVRLGDVAPDGSVRRITYGLHNLALAEDHATVLERRKDEIVQLRVRLKDVAYELPPGHRLRLSLSTACWPLAVGVPRQTSIGLHRLRLDLPLLPPDAAGAAPPGPAVVAAYPQAQPIIAPARGRLEISERLDSEETVVRVVRNLGAVRLADVDLKLHALGSETYTMPWQAPEHATAEATRLARLVRDGRDLRIETRSDLGFDGPDLRFQGRLEAFENDIPVFSRSWDERVPRPRASITYSPRNQNEVEDPT